MTRRVSRSRRPSSSAARRGITLMEVLVTIAIIGIVLPVIMQAISVSTGLAGLTRQRSEATALAQSKIQELLLSGDWQNAALSGDFGPDHPAYRWQSSAVAWDEMSMQQLAVSVTWQSRGTQREVVLTTLVYLPPMTSTTGGTTP